MTISQIPYVIRGREHTPELFRQALQGLLSGTGVQAPGDLQVKAFGGMIVEVAIGGVYIPGTQGFSHRINTGSQSATFPAAKANFTSQGTYAAYNNATVLLTLGTASSVHPRIDLVVVKVEDTEYSGSNNQCVLAVVTGTPEASPKPPTVPENCVVLAKVEVPTSATEIKAANVTDERPGVMISPLRLGEHGSSLTAAPGELAKCTGAITVTLPEPTANAMVGVLANNHEVKVAAGEALIYGDFIEGATPITLVGYQHVVLVSDGTNWFIVAGEPKRTATYAAVERKEGESWTPSATRPAFLVFKAESGGAVTLEVRIKVAGAEIINGRYLGKGEAVSINPEATNSLVVPAGASVELASLKGSVPRMFVNTLLL